MNQLVTHDMLTAALALDVPARVKGDSDADPMRGRHIGHDCARSAKGDWNMCVLYVDGVKSKFRRWRGLKTTQTAARILDSARRWGVTDGDGHVLGQNIHVDVGGLGVGVCDDLSELGVYVDRVDYGGEVEDDWPALDGAVKFRSRKAQLYWRFRRAVQLGWVQVPERYERTWEEATYYTYDHDQREKLIIVEDKDQVRKDLKRSTDDFDADCNALSRAGGGAPQFGTIDDFTW